MSRPSCPPPTIRPFDGPGFLNKQIKLSCASQFKSTQRPSLTVLSFAYRSADHWTLPVHCFHHHPSVKYHLHMTPAFCPDSGRPADSGRHQCRRPAVGELADTPRTGGDGRRPVAERFRLLPFLNGNRGCGACSAGLSCRRTDRLDRRAAPTAAAEGATPATGDAGLMDDTTTRREQL